MKRASLLLLPALCLLPGCLPGEAPRGLPTVANNQFGTPPQTRSAARANLPAPDSGLAAKVDSVGHNLLALNKDSGLDRHMLFIVYPSTSVEIFHVGKDQLYVTEGLVRKCSSEDLSAVLALELGKMAAERRAATRTVDLGQLNQCPPIFEQIGNDSVMPQTNMAERAKYETQMRARKQSRPDPRQLAEVFLEKAGVSKNYLNSVQPLLDEASLNNAVETQIKGPRPSWEP